MKIIWLNTATNNLRDLTLYIASDNVRIASMVAELIETQVNALVKYPYLGSASQTAGVRCLVIHSTPFTVFYRVRNNQIRILRVMHQAQKPQY